MSKPVIAQKCPYVIDMDPGRKAWCSCGLSTQQPFCDGSHRGTEFKPIIYEIKVKSTIAWCGCKHTQTPPVCDGSHQLLEKEKK